MKVIATGEAGLIRYIDATGGEAYNLRGLVLRVRDDVELFK